MDSKPEASLFTSTENKPDEKPKSLFGAPEKADKPKSLFDAPANGDSGSLFAPKATLEAKSLFEAA